MRRLLVVVLLSVLGLGLAVGTAMAHDRLDSSDPAPGTTLTTAPHQITLNFAEAPDPAGAAIAVTGPTGGHLEAGAPTINGSAVTAALVSDVPNGTYNVVWHVVSDDGHPVGGTFTFTVESPAAQPALASSPAASPPPAAASPGSGLPMWPWLGGLVALVVLGGVVAAVRTTRARK